jgi:hypothetical protein
MVLDATFNSSSPLTLERFLGWHAALFLASYIGLRRAKNQADWRGGTDCPLFDFTFEPSRRPTLRLHRFREVSYLVRLVDAAARSSVDSKHFLYPDELHACTVTRCAAFDSHINSLLSQDASKTNVNETS